MKQLVGYVAKCFAFIIAIQPRRVRLFYGDVIGFLWFDVLRVRRKVAIENVTIAFPEKSLKERTAIARASLHHLGRTIIEFAFLPFLNEKNVHQYYKFYGIEHVEAALKQGKGAILLSMHVGNGDFGAAAMSRNGMKAHLISKEFKARWLNDLWFGMRRKHGTKFISPEKSSFEILRALKKNELVIFVLDQFMGPPVGVRTKFFGRETGTALGCALMASRTHAPVIPSYTWRNPDGTHTGIFEAPIPYLDKGPIDENIAAMTQTYTDKIESIVREHPEQWMWIHRRWKEFRD